MAILKKTLFKKDFAKINTLIVDRDPNSLYFKVTDLSDTFSGGKNSFLIQGSPYLVNGTEVKIEIIDALGNTIYYEPAKGNPEPYEGVAKPIAVHIYPDTAFGPCTITILGELSNYVDQNGSIVQVPDRWKNTYNVKWQKTINVNPKLRNTTKIRFYKVPKVEITEEILPIYNRTPDIRKISSSVDGIAINPIEGEDFTTFNGLVNYQLRITDSNAFTQSMEGIPISVNGLSQSFSASITDVVTSKVANVSVPYFETSSLNPNIKIIKNFQSGSFTSSFEVGSIIKDSNINSSFATIKITDLDTFTGDVHRVRVYGKSLNTLGDYQLLEDVQLESNDLLIKREFSSSLNVRSGIFTEPVIRAFWKTGSLSTGVTWQVDDTLLTKSAKLIPTVDSNNNNGLFYFATTQSIGFTKDTEYQLDFTPLLSSSIVGNGILDVYLTGSAFIDTDINFGYGKKVLGLETKTPFRRYDKQQVNFIADKTGTGDVLFFVKSGVWQLSDVSLSAAAETSFSPNEVTLTVNIPNKINQEKFEFKFEFYDINNKFVPIDLKKEYTFTGGNDLVANKDIILTLSNNSFAFAADNVTAFPEYINFNVQTVAITGSLTFTSAAFDITGTLIPINLSPYPGLLTKLDENNWRLTSQSFSGSLENYKVGAITYTASADNVKRYATVYRLNEGKIGKTGPGVVYRGEWSASVDYIATDLRRDVVLGKFWDTSVTPSPQLKDRYYICAVSHKSINGQRPSDDNTGNSIGNVWQNLWTSFSAEFDSVATDILFAQDVYANRTINIGSKGGNPLIALDSDYANGNKNPSIKISASFYNDNGIFLGYDSGSPKLSLKGGANSLTWNGSVLTISGSIAATNGRIAGWVIDQESLRDENTKIVLNPTAPSIGIFKETGGVNIKKLDIRRGNLTAYDANLIGDIQLDPPIITIDAVTFSGFNSSVSIYKSSPISSSVIINNTDPLNFTANIDWAVGSNNPDFLSTNDFFEGNITFLRGIGIKDSNDNIVQVIYDTPVYLNEPNQNKTFNKTPKQYNFTFPAAGTYKCFTFYDVNGYFYSNDPLFGNNAEFKIRDQNVAPQNTGDLEWNHPIFNLQGNAELSEFTDEGFQVLKNNTKYFRIKREDSDGANDKVIARVGGTVLFDAETSDNTAIDIINGNINLRNGSISGNVQFSSGDIIVGGNNNIRVTNGYIGTNASSGGAIRMGTHGGRGTLVAKEWASSSASGGGTIKLRILSTTKLGITSDGNARELMLDSSTIRIKKDIEDYPNSAYESIKKLKPVLYTPLKEINSKEEDNYDDLYPMPNPKKYIGKQGGFIAEWLDEDPEMRRYVVYGVSGSVCTTDSLSYDRLIVPLTKAVQILMEKVEKLEAQISGSI